jgi:hypothetical protein
MGRCALFALCDLVTLCGAANLVRPQARRHQKRSFKASQYFPMKFRLFPEAHRPLRDKPYQIRRFIGYFVDPQSRRGLPSLQIKSRQFRGFSLGVTSPKLLSQPE